MDVSGYFQVPYNLVLAMIFGLLSVLSILGNLLVLVIILRYKRLRTQTNLLLANLASIDLLTGLFGIPFSAVTALNGTWRLGATACQINGFLNALFAGASIHTLMYIAVQKHLSLRSSRSAMSVTASSATNTVIMIVAAWIWAVVFASGLVTGWTSIEYKNGTTQCGPKVPDRGNVREISHSLFTSITNYAIPFAVICFCYVSIFRTFRKAMETLKSHFQALSRRDYLHRQRKIVITLVIIFCSFLVCLTPYICYSSMAAFSNDKLLVPQVLNPVAYIFLHLSSCINPVIYAFRSNEFAAGYRSIMKILCCEARGMCLAKPDMTEPYRYPLSVMQRDRRSMEALRLLAGKAPKLPPQLPFRQFMPLVSQSPSVSSQSSLWHMGRIPRRRSLSMWSTQDTKESPLMRHVTVIQTQPAALSTNQVECTAGSPQAVGGVPNIWEPRDRLRTKVVPQKSTIQEENSSDLGISGCGPVA